MTMIKGIEVVLIDKTPDGKDDFGKTLFTEKEIIVENVLVVPTLSDDIINQLSLTGKKAVYTLGIPKGDTNNWEDREVRFFGQKWRTFGIPTEGIDHLIPLDWNKKVMVERYD